MCSSDLAGEMLPQRRGIDLFLSPENRVNLIQVALHHRDARQSVALGDGGPVGGLEAAVVGADARGLDVEFLAQLGEVQDDGEARVVADEDAPLGVADVGTVIHPRAFGGQMFGRSSLGWGHALAQKWVYDQHYGAPLAKRFYQNRPPTILDVPVANNFKWEAVNIPDPETPVGARGIGEPPVGAAAAAVTNALADALGDEVFRRAPVTSDVILTALETGKPGDDPLTAHV